jgi:acyl carrier protein
MYTKWVAKTERHCQNRQPSIRTGEIMQPTIDQIQTIVKLQLGLKEVDPKQNLVEALGAESVDVVNIIATVEEKYGIFIPEDKLLNIHTITDIYNLVKTQG